MPLDPSSTRPAFCYSRLQANGEVIVVRYGKDGYYKTDAGKQSQEFVDTLNAELGISKPMADAMIICSMSNNWAKLDEICTSLTEKAQA